VQYENFITRVEQEAKVARDEAEIITGAFFETLGSRLTPHEAEDVAAELPSELADRLLERADSTEKFHADAFFERLGAITDTDQETARSQARVVWHVLTGIIETGELEDIRNQLPEDINSELT
jgi:uncharacterized protein (DUF2267 family)